MLFYRLVGLVDRPQDSRIPMYHLFSNRSLSFPSVEKRLMQVAVAASALALAGCNNPVARNIETLCIRHGVDREIVHFIPPAAGVIVTYVLFRFMLKDTLR